MYINPKKKKKKNGANGLFLVSVYAETKIKQKGKNKKLPLKRKLSFRILFPEFWLLVMESSSH